MPLLSFPGNLLVYLLVFETKSHVSQADFKVLSSQGIEFLVLEFLNLEFLVLWPPLPDDAVSGVCHCTWFKLRVIPMASCLLSTRYIYSSTSLFLSPSYRNTAHL